MPSYILYLSQFISRFEHFTRIKKCN